MMMERAKTAPAPEPPSQTKVVVPPVPPVNASAEQRVQDLERRLGLLGEGASPSNGSGAPAASSLAPAAASTTTSAPSSAVNTAAASTTASSKSNPLLARIMAAQERARLAEQKEKDARAQAEQKQQRQKAEEEAAKTQAAEQHRIEMAKSALRLAQKHALEDKHDRILRELEGKPPAAPAAPAAPALPTLEASTSSAPPATTMAPPPFETVNFSPSGGTVVAPPPIAFPMDQLSMQSQQEQRSSNPMQPPSFDFLEQELMKPPPPPAPTAPSPSAPPIAPMASTEDFDHLQGVLPVAPPPTHPTQTQSVPPPPSFAEFEQHNQQQSSFEENAENFENIVIDDDGIFDYDLDGNPLSPEQRQAMMDEQRRLYEVIMKEKAANDAAIARASADAFDSRSSNAAARAMDSHASRNQAMDSVGREGMERASRAASAAGAAEEGGGETEEEGSRPRRMVKIGNGQTVALHGQERTKKAIKEGTAILVQCINCQNWMQVTESATLMFCPVCQVVSPVIKQNEVLTKEEAIQLTMDRKLAERLQAEAYADEEKSEGSGEGEGYFAKLFGSGSSSSAKGTKTSGEATRASTTSASTVDGSSSSQSSSWWDKISSIVSYGVAEEPKERGDLGVTRPPGAADPTLYPAQRRILSPVSTVNNRSAASPTRQNEETQGLLRPVVDGNEANLPAGRVAEQKPLFSCVYDSVSTAASAVFSSGTGEDEEVHGVDASSFLTVTSAGREVGDGSGNYSRVPDEE